MAISYDIVPAALWAHQHCESRCFDRPSGLGIGYEFAVLHHQHAVNHYV